MNIEDTLAKAKDKQDANQYVNTDQLVDRGVLYIDTPWGKGKIVSDPRVSHIRILNGNRIAFYKIELVLVDTGITKIIITAASTQWLLVG